MTKNLSVPGFLWPRQGSLQAKSWHRTAQAVGFRELLILNLSDQPCSAFPYGRVSNHFCDIYYFLPTLNLVTQESVLWEIIVSPTLTPPTLAHCAQRVLYAKQNCQGKVLPVTPWICSRHQPAALENANNFRTCKKDLKMRRMEKDKNTQKTNKSEQEKETPSITEYHWGSDQA